MAFTQADLERIDKAIANGTLSVEVEGKRVAYRTMSDLRDARNIIANELAASSGGGICKTFSTFSRT